MKYPPIRTEIEEKGGEEVNICIYRYKRKDEMR